MNGKKIRGLVWLLILMLGAPGMAKAAKVLNLSNNDGTSSSAQIVTQEANIFVVWEDNELGNLHLDIFLARSTDSGKTFTPRINLSNNNGDSVNAQIAVASSNVYVAWTDFAVGIGDIFFLRSTDGGATFEPVKNLTNNSTPSLFPQLAVDGDNMYVVWQEASASNVEILFRRSTDGGVTFEATKNLSNNAGFSMFPQLVVSDGNVYVAWEDDTPGNGDIFFTRSTDEGVTFAIPENLSNNEGLSERFHFAAAAGSVYVAWHDFTDFDVTLGDILFRRSTDGGASFEDTLNLSDTPEGFSQLPRLAVEGSNVYVVWEDDSPGNIDILLRRSTDSGATFLVAQNLSVQNTGNSVDAKVSVLGTKLVVAWEDDTLGSFDILLSTSKNGGQTFAKPFNFTKKGTGAAERVGIAIQAGAEPGIAGKTLIVWEQDREDSANRDVFVTTK